MKNNRYKLQLQHFAKSPNTANALKNQIALDKAEMGQLMEQRGKLENEIETRAGDFTEEMLIQKNEKLKSIDEDIAELRNAINTNAVELNLKQHKIAEIATGMKAGNTYLESDSAMEDFAKVASRSSDAETFNANWKDHLNKRGITMAEGTTMPVPTQIKDIIDRFAKNAGIIYNGVQFYSVEGETIYPYETEGELGHGDNRSDKDTTEKKEQSSIFDIVKITPDFIYKYVRADKKTLANWKQVEQWIRNELPKRYIETVERAIAVGDGLEDSDDLKITSFVSMHDATATFATPVTASALDMDTLDLLQESIEAEGEQVLIGSVKDFYALKRIRSEATGERLYKTGTTTFGGRRVKTIDDIPFIEKKFVNQFDTLATGQKGLILAVLQGYVRVTQESLAFYTEEKITFNKKVLMVEGMEGGAPVEPLSIAYLVKGEA